jgi:hypothetical protein
MAGVGVFELRELSDGRVSLFKASIWLVSLGIINGVHGNKGNRALIPLASIRRYLNGRPVSPHLASGVHFTHQLPTPSGLAPIFGASLLSAHGAGPNPTPSSVPYLWEWVSTASKYLFINLCLF